MWGRRRKRCTQLSRLLALGDLEDALARAEQHEAEGEPEPVPYLPASRPVPDVPAARPGLLAEDVSVDNSAGLEPLPAEEGAAEHQQQLPVQRTRDSTRHGSFG